MVTRFNSPIFVMWLTGFPHKNTEQRKVKSQGKASKFLVNIVIECRLDGGLATIKENCGVARAPVETEAVQYAWVAYMRSKHRSEKPECARSTRAPGTIWRSAQVA